MVSESSFAPSSPPLPMPNFQFLHVTTPAPGVCQCTLNRPPVNALNTEVWTELLKLLLHLETHSFPTVTRVLLFASAARGPLFSAGHDLREMYTPATTESRFRHFWHVSTTFLTRLYATRLHTVIALRGAVPAAACAIALCCDQRLAMRDVAIGLNEIAIGLPVPPYWARLFLRTASASRARAEQHLAAGDLIGASDAVALHLVDAVVDSGYTSGNKRDGDDAGAAVLREAVTVASEWAKRQGAQSRAELKQMLRAEFASDWLDYSDEEARSAWRNLLRPDTVNALGKLLHRPRPAVARM